jgi:tetratricopeptide (TPR) repeat protein
MAKRNKKASDDTLMDIGEKTEQAQDFYDKNQSLILGGLLAFVLIVGGIFAYNNFYKTPRLNSAIEEMAQAQRMFEKDSFALALANPGNGSLGFLDVASNFSGTSAGNLANYYAGISYLQLGQFDAALSFLEDYSPEGTVIPIAYYSALGDVWSEKNDMDKAISSYKKAIAQGTNEFMEAYCTKKLGMLYEYQGKVAEAKSTYENLKTKYPNTPEGQDIEKFISRVSVN